jgi:UDP-3-O-[3-hydroxymyristoyl] glucosamine N-acyltransferase
MTESFFLAPRAGLTLREIATLTGARPRGGADLDRRITGISALDRAGPHDLCLLDSPDVADQATFCQAGACLTPQHLADLLPERVSALLVDEPFEAFVQVSRALYPDALRVSPLFEAHGVAADAVVHPTARLEAGVTVDPGAVIGPRVEIGAATLIGASTVIGPNVHIGRDCAIQAHVSIIHALIGDRVNIHPGCRIGQERIDAGAANRGHAKMPQIGRVIIQDDVEIGANTVIDRGAMSDTVVGEGTKIDNLVQIAHNALIGRYCVLAPQTSIPASAVVADGAVTRGPTERAMLMRTAP